VFVGQGETKELQAMLSWDYTPSKVQQALRKSSYTLNNLWSYLAGWSEMPQPCQTEEQLAGNHNEQESRENAFERSQEQQYSSEYGQQQSYWGKLWNKQQWSQEQQRSSEENRSGNKYEQEQKRENRFNRRSEWSDSSEDYQRDSMHTENGNGKSVTVQKMSIAENVPEWRIVLKCKAVGGAERSLHVSAEGKSHLAQLLDTVRVKVQVESPRLRQGKLEVCAEAEIQNAKVPCNYDQFQPSKVGQQRSQIKITWGHSQCQADNYINVQAKMSKSQRQLEYESAAKPWYFKQCMEERRKGLKFEEACQKLYNKVTDLNKVDVRVQYNNLPAEVKNVSCKVDNFVKMALYNHMSNDPVTGHNEPKKLRIVAEFSAHKPSLDLKVLKPEETTIFTQVKYKKSLPMLTSPNAKRSFVQQIADRITGRQFPASCDISAGKYVDTFNNLTYKHHMGACTYLAARDCSPNGLFAVFVSGPDASKSGPGNGIKVDVQLLKNKIKAHPVNEQKTKYKIQINNENMQELEQGQALVVYDRKESKGAGEDEPIALITLAGHFLTIKCPAHGLEIKFDGKDVRIEASYFWQGKLCGLCGNFDSDTQDEFEGPGSCTFGTAQDFAESFIVPNGQCQKRSHSSRMICNQNDDETRSIYPQLQQSSGRSSRYESSNNRYESSDEQGSRFSSSSSYERTGDKSRSSAGCVHYRNKVLHGKPGQGYSKLNGRNSQRYQSYEQRNQRFGSASDEEQFDVYESNNQICFSIEPIAHCKPGCSPIQQEYKNVKFHCLPKSDYRTQAMLQKQPYEELNLEGKNVDVEEEQQVTVQCRRD
jgi:hypothetical protein